MHGGIAEGALTRSGKATTSNDMTLQVYHGAGIMPRTAIFDNFTKVSDWIGSGVVAPVCYVS